MDHAGPQEPLGLDGPPDGVVVDAELAGDGADPPVLGENSRRMRARSSAGIIEPPHRGARDRNRRCRSGRPVRASVSWRTNRPRVPQRAQQRRRAPGRRTPTASGATARGLGRSQRRQRKNTCPHAGSAQPTNRRDSRPPSARARTGRGQPGHAIYVLLDRNALLIRPRARSSNSGPSPLRPAARLTTRERQPRPIYGGSSFRRRAVQNHALPDDGQQSGSQVRRRAGGAPPSVEHASSSWLPQSGSYPRGRVRRRVRSAYTAGVGMRSHEGRRVRWNTAVAARSYAAGTASTCLAGASGMSAGSSLVR